MSGLVPAVLSERALRAVVVGSAVGIAFSWLVLPWFVSESESFTGSEAFDRDGFSLLGIWTSWGSSRSSVLG